MPRSPNGNLPSAASHKDIPNVEQHIAFWRERINVAWRRTFDTIIETGDQLFKAKKALGIEHYHKVIEGINGLSYQTAQRLIQVSQSKPILAHREHLTGVPFSTLCEIVRLKGENFDEAVEQGLINPSLTVDMARALVNAYRTNLGHEAKPKFISEHYKDRLPTPDAANNIARATGRIVTASDGRLYTGATEEETEDFNRRRRQTFGLIDAVNLISDASSPDQWLSDAEHYWLADLNLGRIDTAIEWLSELRGKVMTQQKVVDNAEQTSSADAEPSARHDGNERADHAA